MAIAPLDTAFHLKSIHAEIDFFDRKLAHLLQHETFATEAERASAAKRLNTKRSALVESAKALIASGVTFNEGELPRSQRPEGVAAATTVRREEEKTAAAVAEVPAGTPGKSQALREWEANLRSYLGDRAKA